MNMWNWKKNGQKPFISLIFDFFIKKNKIFSILLLYKKNENLKNSQH